MKHFQILTSVAFAASLPAISQAQETETAPPVFLTQEGETPDPAEVTTPTETRKEACIRVWTMLPPEVPPSEFGAAPSLKDKISLVYTLADGTDESLVSQATPYGLMGYRGIGPGGYKLRLMKQTGDESIELASESVGLLGGSFTTVIVHRSGASYRLLVVDETHAARKPAPSPGEPPSPPPPKEIVFYDFLPDSRVTVGSTKPSFKKELSSGKVERISNLPASIFTIQTRGERAGKSFGGQSEANLVTHDSLSYVLIEDIYGRIVPALLPNATLD